jgi:hypothetical protein
MIFSTVKKRFFKVSNISQTNTSEKCKKDEVRAVSHC